MRKMIDEEIERRRKEIANALIKVTDCFMPYWKMDCLKKDKRCVDVILGCKVML